MTDPLYKDRTRSAWKEEYEQKNYQEVRAFVNQMLDELKIFYSQTQAGEVYPHINLLMDISTLLFRKEAETLRKTVYQKYSDRLDAPVNNIIHHLKRRNAIYLSGIDKVHSTLSTCQGLERFTLCCAFHGETFTNVPSYLARPASINPCCRLRALERLTRMSRRPDGDRFSIFQLTPLMPGGESTPKRWLSLSLPTTKLIVAPSRYLAGPTRSIRDFRDNVRKQCNYTCPYTGDNKMRDLVFHHLYNITDYPYLGYVPGNGVLINNRIHVAFHNAHPGGLHQGPVTIDHFILFTASVCDSAKLSLELHRANKCILQDAEVLALEERIPHLELYLEDLKMRKIYLEKVIDLYKKGRI